MLIQRVWKGLSRLLRQSTHNENKKDTSMQIEGSKWIAAAQTRGFWSKARTKNKNVAEIKTKSKREN